MKQIFAFNYIVVVLSDMHCQVGLNCCIVVNTSVRELYTLCRRLQQVVCRFMRGVLFSFVCYYQRALLQFVLLIEIVYMIVCDSLASYVVVRNFRDYLLFHPKQDKIKLELLYFPVKYVTFFSNILYSWFLGLLCYYCIGVLQRS